MTAGGEVVGLVERFEEQRGHYRAGQYNEAQLREEFLNPLFAALGWDVYKRKGYAEAYKEVASARTPQDKTLIQRQIDATDRQIDRLVYELYDLTDEESGIVEEATR